MTKNYNILDIVNSFMVAGDVPTDTFNPRQIGLYVGLQLEEMAEKLEAIFGGRPAIVDDINDLATDFKQGIFDKLITKDKMVDMIDADVDLMWVSAGAAFSTGADVAGAVAEVGRSNMSKVDPTTGKMNKDANGKIMKPASYSPPSLAQFCNK